MNRSIVLLIVVSIFVLIDFYVFHFDLFGKRNDKYNFLQENSLRTIDFKELKPEKPFLLFVNRINEGSYFNNTFQVNDLFLNNVTGTQTGNDKFLFNYNKENLVKALNEISTAEYLDNFNKLAEKIWAQTSEQNLLLKKKKSVDFLLRKGYETSLIYDKIQELSFE